ncbi:MAG: penicillin-binding protein activator [Gammaproteobacteria bacterium]|nr:penicillin-binding protein activator [Gammaproteobacteria bacterium]
MHCRDAIYSLFLLLFCLALASCAKTGLPQTGDDTTQRLQQEVDNALQGAIFQAKQLRSPEREYQLLQIASSLFHQGALDQASAILHEMEVGSLALGLLIRRQLLAAQIAEEMGSPLAVIKALEPLQGIPLGEATQARQYYQLQVAAYQQLQRYPQEADARIGIMAYISDGEARLDNIQRLLDIALITDQQLTDEHDPLIRQHLQQRLGQILGALENWRYRGSTRQESLLLEGTPEAADTLQVPQQIAILLPLTGRYSQPANAVRDGILSAYYEQQSTSTLRFYDTQGKKELAWSAYRQALEEGAHFIIGPLTKESVDHLAMIEAPQVPLLALNHTRISRVAPNGFYQLALSPEDEAIQAALYAWNSGLRHPVILTPGNNWGERISLSFQETWNLLGGEVRSKQSYNPKESDFSKPIRAAFELDLSDKRRQQLQRSLRSPLKFTPRRRQDVDFIFIAAQPRQARLLRPQFKFHYASNIPIYGTSHLYQGTPDPQQDRDMDGIIFGDTPWTLDTDKERPLRNKILSIWPNAHKKHWRLYAMGIDAYRLSAFLQTRPSQLNYYGETGHMQLTHEGQLYRQLEWARFYRGKPRKLSP